MYNVGDHIQYKNHHKTVMAEIIEADEDCVTVRQIGCDPTTISNVTLDDYLETKWYTLIKAKHFEEDLFNVK